MKLTVAMLVLGLVLPGISFAGSTHCQVHSDFDVSVQDDRVVFASHPHPELRFELRDGELRLDGRALVLSRADRQRIIRIEREARALLPEVREIVLAAMDIAFSALTEVAHALIPDSRIGDRLAATRQRMERELQQPIRMNGDALGDAIADTVGVAVGELVPELVGEAVSAAVSAALSGDMRKAEALEARADVLEREIERRIEPRAEALGRRAQALCQRLQQIDQVESELELELPDGQRLDLLQTGPN